MDVSGKVFVVTGGGNGIGREVVLQLLARGARVAAVDLNADALAETASLAAADDALSTHTIDITDRSAVEALPAAVTAAHGAIDGLVNVAGIIQPFVKVAELGYDQIERVMNVNFWGVVNTTKTLLPTLLARPAASLVNVSSMGALAPVPGQAAYGASKAAVKLFTEALYAELQGTNVAVTVVFPGAVGTGIATNSGVEIPNMPDADAAQRKTTSPAEAGLVIVEAIAKGEFRVRIGSDATMLDRLSRLSPRRATLLIAKQMKDLLG
ncbi:SDR family oxidoreductase [uncultured Schumannella sp.]|uniref:SDR family NAD(P)-dependent oxidoreductase n=1 Tax=uncultured Schumannella sp. TaxID=1195956 RepID=UPI0025D182BD|nr:SDR family oxidoreductase [uncultured Schumannella sp.]